MLALHNKKRPHNLVLGRMYEHTLLDMAEFGIENYKGLKDFKVPKVSEGIKPLLVFNGELFENNHELNRIKNLLVDMFQREPVENIRLQGLEHVLSFTAVENKIMLRSYRILLKKSDCRTPRIELEEIGPRADLLCRRTKLASEDLFKQACKKPKELKVKLVFHIIIYFHFMFSFNRRLKRRRMSLQIILVQPSVVYMSEHRILIAFKQER